MTGAAGLRPEAVKRQVQEATFLPRDRRGRGLAIATWVMPPVRCTDDALTGKEGEVKEPDWTKKELTFGDILHPAMAITDQAEADAYFEKMVQYNMRFWGKSREESEQTQKSNLGYFAGYYDSETRERVERLFKCSHPVFGKIAENGAPTFDEALEAGKRMARAART